VSRNEDGCKFREELERSRAISNIFELDNFIPTDFRKYDFFNTISQNES
jgi:hypothetical protein